MKVIITYYDSDTLTKEEVIRQAKDTYGEHTQVEVMPTSDDPKDLLYFAMQQMSTYEQLSALFDAPHLYQKTMNELRARMLNICTEELEAVIKDNEKRVS